MFRLTIHSYIDFETKAAMETAAGAIQKALGDNATGNIIQEQVKDLFDSDGVVRGNMTVQAADVVDIRAAALAKLDA